MGIKGLNKFLLSNDYCNYYSNLENYLSDISIQKKKKGDNTNVCVGIDFWLYAYKYAYSGKKVVESYFYLILTILSYGAIPFIIFDGKAPIEKKNIIKERSNKKEKIGKKLKDIEKKILSDKTSFSLLKQRDKLKRSIVDISNKEIIEIKDMLDMMNIPYKKAKGEADYLAAYLYKQKIIDTCMTEDTDLIAHGCKKIFYQNRYQIIEFNLNEILKSLSFTMEEFIDMCLLSGCDYVRTPYRLKPYEIYAIITDLKDKEDNLNIIEDVVNYLEAADFIISEKKSFLLNNMQNGKKLFMNSYKRECCDIVPLFTPLKYKILLKISRDNEFFFDAFELKMRINHINKKFQKET